MKTFFILLIAFVLFGCDSKNDLPKEPVFTSADSTAMVKVIMDSLRSEYESQWFMQYGCETWGVTQAFKSTIAVGLNEYETTDLLVISDKITDAIIKFYSSNLYSSKSEVVNMKYTSLYKENLLQEIKQLEIVIKELQKSDIDLSIIDYRKEQLAELNAKLNIFILSSKNKIMEADLNTGVEFYHPKNVKLKDQFLDSILFAYYKIREIDAQNYYQESYAHICWKAIKLKDSTAIKKMLTFKILHPVTVIDSKLFSYMDVPPPPLPPARIIDPVKLPIDIIVEDSIDIVPKMYSN